MARGVFHSGFFTWALLMAACNFSAAEFARPAPQCALNHWHTGQPLSLEAFKGQVVYVDFWASWCAPCVESLPFLQRLQQEFGGRGFQVLGINLDAERSHAEAFLLKHPVHFSLAANPGADCPKDFGVAGMPAGYLIDRQGRIRHHHLGYKASHAASLRTHLEQLLNEPVPPPLSENKK